MIRDWWVETVNRLADKGIPLYKVTDWLDDAGLPSWAVLGAIGLILFFLIAFLLIPTARATLTVKTTDNAIVTVTYDKVRLRSTVENNTASFRIPLGTSINIKITKSQCTPETIELIMLDHYSLEKHLVCM